MQTLNEERKHIILKVENQGLLYNEHGLISWEQTNFPDKESFTVRTYEPIYWRVFMERFDKATNELMVRVVDYNVEDIAGFAKQKPKKPIHRLTFNSLDWNGVIQHLSSYTTRELEQLITRNDPETRTSKQASPVRGDWDFSASHRIKIDFKIPLSETRFGLGMVELTKELKDFDEPLDIKIYNEDILPEFDYIKPFFAKALGKRKIGVQGWAEIDDNGEVRTSCRSQEVDRINQELISSVRQIRIRKAIESPRVIAVDKSLFTAEEFFDGMEDKEHLGNALPASEQDILKEVLESKGIRNAKQLTYLAGKLHAQDEKMRFSLPPKFGFLFCVKGEKMHHFIWELLNSNATYIWSIDRGEMNMKQKIARIEEIIGFIRNHGRMAYLRNEDDEEFVFSKINHAQANSPVVDGFPRWKARVNQLLV